MKPSKIFMVICRSDKITTEEKIKALRDIMNMELFSEYSKKVKLIYESEFLPQAFVWHESTLGHDFWEKLEKKMYG